MYDQPPPLEEMPEDAKFDYICKDGAIIPKSELGQGELGAFRFSVVGAYKGDFRDGKPHGTGTIYWPNGSAAYKGRWEMGKPHGDGSEWDSTGRRMYVGLWRNGRRHGEGAEYSSPRHSRSSFHENLGFFTRNCIFYNGLWRNGKKHGHGTSYHENGQRQYEGPWKDGKKHGHGTSYDENGQMQYEGPWKNGKKQGHGTSYHKDGQREYEGLWKNGKKQGHGTSYHKDGQREYEGPWEAGHKHGRGTSYHKDGQRQYEGLWKNGKKQGHGTSYYNSGIKEYEGMWKHGNKHGVGTSFFPGGEKQYEGDWKNGQRHGTGKLYDDDGNLVFSGNWIGDEPQRKGAWFYYRLKIFLGYAFTMAIVLFDMATDGLFLFKNVFTTYTSVQSVNCIAPFLYQNQTDLGLACGFLLPDTNSPDPDATIPNFPFEHELEASLAKAERKTLTIFIVGVVFFALTVVNMVNLIFWQRATVRDAKDAIRHDNYDGDLREIGQRVAFVKLASLLVEDLPQSVLLGVYIVLTKSLDNGAICSLCACEQHNDVGNLCTLADVSFSLSTNRIEFLSFIAMIGGTAISSSFVVRGIAGALWYKEWKWQNLFRAIVIPLVACVILIPVCSILYHNRNRLIMDSSLESFFIALFWVLFLCVTAGLVIIVDMLCPRGRRRLKIHHRDEEDEYPYF